MTASESTAPVGLRAKLRSSSMRIKINCHFFALSLLGALLPPLSHCSCPLFARSLTRSLSPCVPPRLSALSSCVLLRFRLVAISMSLPRVYFQPFLYTQVPVAQRAASSRTDAHSHICEHASLQAPVSRTGLIYTFLVSVRCLLTSQLSPAPRYRSHPPAYDGQRFALHCFAPVAACPASTTTPVAVDRCRWACGPPQAVEARRGARPLCTPVATQALLLPGCHQPAHPLSAERARGQRRPRCCRPHPGAAAICSDATHRPPDPGAGPQPPAHRHKSPSTPTSHNLAPQAWRPRATPASLQTPG